MIDSTPFFKKLLPSLLGKEKKDSDLSEAELKAIVANEYACAVSEVATDTEDYLLDIAIDLYKESRYYPVNVPDDFTFIDIQRIERNGYKFNGSVQQNLITLPCCPSKDVPKAWYAKVAVSPKRTSGLCEFDEEFVNRYFTAILLKMRYNLAIQDAMKWHSVGKSDRLNIEYKKAIRRLSKKKGVTRIKQESFTNDAVCTVARARCTWC